MESFADSDIHEILDKFNENNEPIKRRSFEDSFCLTDYVLSRAHTVENMSNHMALAEQKETNKPLDWASAHRSFFADSPYYYAFVEKEMRTIEVATDVINDIGTKFTAYAKAGLLFAKATRRLSNACKLQSVSQRGNDDADILETKREALGYEITSTLESVAVILDKIANAQKEFHTMVEHSIGAPLSRDAVTELDMAKRLRKEAETKTSSAERMFADYLHGKTKGGMSATEDDGGSASDVTAPARKSQAAWSWTRTKNFLTSSKDPDDDDDHSSSHKSIGNIGDAISRTSALGEDTQKKQVIHLAKQKHALQKIRLEQFTAELKRFQVFKNVVDTKYQRNSKISEYLGEFCAGLHVYGRKCADLIDFHTKEIKEYQGECKRVLSDHGKHDKPVWQQRENLLFETMQEMKKAVQDTDDVLHNVSNLSTDTIRSKIVGKKPAKGRSRLQTSDADQTILSLEDLEENVVKIWDLPVELASCSRYLRDAANGVLAEGWLYEETHSMMALQTTWKRSWFIMKSDGIFCLQTNPQYRFHGSAHKTEESFSKVKICDMVLCTVREVPYNTNTASPTATATNSNVNMNQHCSTRSTVEQQQPERFCFELIITSNQRNRRNNKPMVLQAVGPKELRRWVDGIRSAVADGLVKGDANSKELNKNIGERSRAEELGAIMTRGLSVFALGDTRLSMKFRETLEDSMHDLMESLHEGSSMDWGSTLGEGENSKSFIDVIMAANPSCADCGQEDPDWVSLNLGVLVCLECSGVHRSLGVHVSKVRSLTLDSLSDAEAGLLISLGNERMNGIWEEQLVLGVDKEEKTRKPSSSANRASREEWIKSKYVEKEFLGRSISSSLNENEDNNNNGNTSSENNNDSRRKLSEELLDATSNDDVVHIARLIAHGANVNYNVTRKKSVKTENDESIASSSSSSSSSSASSSSSEEEKDKGETEKKEEKEKERKEEEEKENKEEKEDIEKVVDNALAADNDNQNENNISSHQHGHGNDEVDNANTNDGNGEKGALEISILRIEEGHTQAVVCAELLIQNGAYVDDFLCDEFATACSLLSIKHHSR